MQRLLTICFFLQFSCNGLFAQNAGISLEDCFKLAAQNNLSIRQMQQSVTTRQYQYDASRLSALPDVDLLGGYTYLSDPIQINLQTVRQGIVNGTSQQNVDAANKVYHEITGNNLSQDAQNAIYNSSQNIINGVYPNYNPSLSDQQYFTTGLALKMPVYLGGKLDAARDFAGKQLASGKLNLQLTQNSVELAITTQYLQVLYLNSMLESQRQLLKLFEKTKDNAIALVKNEVIPPYQAHWANVALTQAETGLKTFELEKVNALLTLQNFMGTDSSISLTDTIKAVDFSIPMTPDNYVENNIGYQWLQAKTDEAKSSVKVSRSLSRPNIFAIGNYQFLRKDLPVITPAWMAGIVFQWNLFSSFENSKHVNATKSLVKESELLTMEKKANLQLEISIAQNKIKSFSEQMKTLDAARKESATTTEMVRGRMANQLASVKDVNDALKVQLEADQAYYTSVLAYDIAVAAYLNIIGTPRAIADYLK